MSNPARPPDFEATLTDRELSQAIVDYLAPKHQVLATGGTSEATGLMIGLNGAPHVFKLWVLREPTPEKRDCDTCENKAMDMDMDPYCAAVNQPWGASLCRGKPKECGPDSLLWKKDGRRRLFGETFPPKPEPVTSTDGNPRRQGDT